MNMKEYLWEQWKLCNHPKYYQYFDEWYNNITDTQKMYFKCWSEGKKSPYCQLKLSHYDENI